MSLLEWALRLVFPIPRKTASPSIFWFQTQPRNSFTPFTLASLPADRVPSVHLTLQVPHWGAAVWRLGSVALTHLLPAEPDTPEATWFSRSFTSHLPTGWPPWPPRALPQLPASSAPRLSGIPPHQSGHPSPGPVALPTAPCAPCPTSGLTCQSQHRSCVARRVQADAPVTPQLPTLSGPHKHLRVNESLRQLSHRFAPLVSFSNSLYMSISFCLGFPWVKKTKHVNASFS